MKSTEQVLQSASTPLEMRHCLESYSGKGIHEEGEAVDKLLKLSHFRHCITD